MYLHTELDHARVCDRRRESPHPPQLPAEIARRGPAPRPTLSVTDLVIVVLRLLHRRASGAPTRTSTVKRLSFQAVVDLWKDVSTPRIQLHPFYRPGKVPAAGERSATRAPQDVLNFVFHHEGAGLRVPRGTASLGLPSWHQGVARCYRGLGLAFLGKMAVMRNQPKMPTRIRRSRGSTGCCCVRNRLTGRG